MASLDNLLNRNLSKFEIESLKQAITAIEKGFGINLFKITIRKDRSNPSEVFGIFFERDLRRRNKEREDNYYVKPD